MSVTVVLVPGYGNSGPQHWQSFIEHNYQNVTRVQQQNWDKPERKQWLETLNKTIAAIDGKVLLVGHSCGAVAITQWAATYQSDKIIGALLVAPADVDSETAIPEIRVQRPLSFSTLPFPSIVVCSDNDPYLSLERGLWFASQWGSEVITLANAGHIHTESGYGKWPQGVQLIEKLLGNPLQISCSE